MSLEITLRECCGGLSSQRANERKKSAEALKDFLSNNAVPTLLSDNTCKRQGYTWNDVFNDINDYVLKETEKFESAKNFGTTTSSSLLSLCVSGSIKGKAYIKCDKIMDASLYILKNHRLTKAIGDVYWNMLYKYVLSNGHYMGFITPSTWEELLSLCLSTCVSKNCTDDFTKMKLLSVIIKNAKNNCQFVIPLRDSLKELKRCFQKFMDDKKMQEIIIDIMIVILETLSSECRLTVCEFTENILKSILSCYDPIFDKKKKPSYFKLLYHAVLLHHPCAVLRSEAGSFAHDWDTWTKQLHTILEIVYLESTSIQKYYKQNDKNSAPSNYYSRLAASAYFQVINLSPENKCDNEEPSTSKRQKISSSNIKTFQDLIEELKQNCCPWLYILHRYVQQYGRSLSQSDNIFLIVTLENVLTQTNANMKSEILEETICGVLKNLLKVWDSSNEEYNKTIISLWNTCVRSSTVVNPGQMGVHKILQVLLDFNCLQFINVHSLIKLYYEKAMPVTDFSIKTLSRLFERFFSKCCSSENRLNLFNWLSQDQIMTANISGVQELILRLVANENFTLHQAKNVRTRWETLHDVIFNAVDKSILFSEFELDMPNPAVNQERENAPFDLVFSTNEEVKKYLRLKLVDYIERHKSREFVTAEFMKFVNIALAYLDIMLQRNIMTCNEVKEDQLYCLTKTSLRLIYLSLTENLKNKEMREQIKLLSNIKAIIISDFVPLLKSTVRATINQEFILCINHVLNEVSAEGSESFYEEDDNEMNPNILRRQCITLLAAYCKEPEEHREEILKTLVLDPSIYNFSISWDIETCFQCIELLSEIADPPLDLMFDVMQSMCRELFRNPQISCRILKTLSKLLEKLWVHDDSMKRNSYIMIKSYLQRCGQSFYPPYMAGLVYECAAKMAALNVAHSNVINNDFLDIIIEKIKGNTHSIRLYCCYLLQLVVVHLSSSDLESHSKSLLDIFVITVSESNDNVLKDESANRTLTLLHSFFALTEVKASFVNTLLTQIIQIQYEKSLNEKLVKKILNRIATEVTKQSIEEYLNNNILTFINFWFSNNKSIQQLPLSFFGFEKLDEFVETHLKWLVAADALWCKDGDVRQSDVLKYVQHKFGKSVEEIIEASICNIIVLCLPYIVVEKYRLSYSIPGKHEWTKSAHKMFETTRQMLGANKWSGLFGDNLGQIVLLVATHLSDPTEAARMFQVDVPTMNKSYQYSKEVYLSILRYFGELTDGNIMQHLCENWPLAIFNTLYQLWRRVLQDNVFQYRVVSLHAFLTVLESIPWGNASDAFVCNFACNSLGHGVKESQTKDDVKILCKALQLFLESCFADKKKVLQKSVARILSILMIKKDAGFGEESAALLAYLTEVMRDADPAASLQESSDVVDFYRSLSQGVVQNSLSATKENFLKRLKMYKKSLLYLSLETLLDLKQFLKNNKVYVTTLSEDLNRTGGSDDCRTNILHQIVHRLCEILKTASNSKIILETSNCLAEIGNYDLNTLTTTPPPKIKIVTNVEPKQYFTVSAINSLTDVLFDEKPEITNLAVKALKRILKYREGTNAVGDGLELVDTEILKPFTSTESRMVLEFKISDAKFHSTCATNFWLPKDLELQTEWLTRVTLGLLDMLIGTDISSLGSCLTALRAVCESKPSVCQKNLSALVGVLLACSTEHQINKMGEQVNQFFKYIWDKNFDDTVASSYDSVAHNRLAYALDQDHKMIVRYMLDIVNFVRLQRSNHKARSARLAENLNYLRLEYDKVAWAATVADQSVVAIYYGELWAAAGRGGVPPASPEDTSAMPGGENVQRIFRKCLVSIGEMDALDGCGTAHLTSEDERRKHLINTGLYTDALLLHDVALSCGSANPELQYGAIKSLHKAGLHHLALQYMSTVTESEELNDIKFDCLSYLGDWSVFVDTRALDDKAKQPNCNMNSVIKAYRYSCLKDCLNLQTSNGFETKLIGPLSRAKLSIAKLCQSLNMENCQSVYRVLSNLHLLVDIEDYYAVRCNEQSVGDLLDRWRVEKMPKFHDFKYIEATINQRTSILEHAAKTFDRSIKDIVSLQLHYADLSLSNQRIQMAQRVLAVVKKQQNTQEVALLDSQISWAKGHKDIALSLLRNIINHPSPDTKLMAKSLRQYGLWMAESKCDNAREIIHKYLQKSLEVLENDERDETTLKVYHEIANFADSEYKEVVSYMSSSVFENKVKCVETMKDTVCSLRATQALNRDDKIVLNTNDKLGKIDEAEIASTRAEKESFLRLAMRYYLLSLKEGEANNLSIFRVISLWLSNPNLEFSASEEPFEELLHSIPSRKFIPVLPQLAPHLTTTHSVFADNLTRIIKRCALEHPHHTLPILFSLKNSDKDEMILNSSQRSRRAAAEPRVAAAHALVEELARGPLAKVITQMNAMCDAMISFANYVPLTKEVRQSIPSAERIHRLGHLDTIPVPTDNIPISHDCKYTSIDSLFQIESHFELVGGNNCPKKIKCITLNGQARIVLVKGKDDLRQDAVMQQVFSIVNTLLDNNTITRKKKLTIRTYKVVPMSRRSGVLEWCVGTMPIGSFLVGSQGAHTRYRPQDTTPNAMREKLSIMHQRRNTNQEKLKVFLRLLENFKPVFHYFFTENYLDPVTWYERRLAYTKSVATSSMVGYIMGLGDRHVQNILIDKETAEVIHIDFGIAFDQGKALPTPETVPFRLTQDIVAGFGSCGVEGIFRRSCETTMQLLRDNQETLLTILEVLLCDPLYNWIIKSKQQNVQTAPSNDTTVIPSDTEASTESSDGSLARRALLSVSSKLSGAEGGAGGVAAAGQVARLLAAAADPANLCRLFPGWQPYL